MNSKPDDYYNNGLIEIARFGTDTVLKNNMTEKQQQKTKNRLKKKYTKLKRKIDRYVSSIRNKVVKCDPISLLSFCSDVFLMSNFGISSEFQLSKDNINDARLTEYIQSVIVSSTNKYKPSSKDPSKSFFRIQKDVSKLFDLIHIFYFSWGAKLEDLCPEYDEEIRKTIVESQFLFNVRGQRYQVYELEYFEKLLLPHNHIFTNLFNVSASEIINGIKKLQYSLTQGKMDAISDLEILIDKLFENDDQSAEAFCDDHQKERNSFVENFLGTKLRNVQDVTGWPEEFIKNLSWEIDECTDFFNEQEYSGWPIKDLPIQKRPFIKIDDQYYCFDYYSFVDNFYRSIQKAISRVSPEYKWSDVQKDASENMVSDVFSQILPGCTIHKENYYPKSNSTKNLIENDLLIEYDNALLIVEVKAGSFVYTPPITDFENHIRSYKTLIEKADHQCMNTYNYLKTKTSATLYTYDGTEKSSIDMSQINDIYMITVTIDNINDFAARAEKLNFLQLKCNAISLSIDDLMVYRDYFESPLIFMHFLKQRRQATQEEKLALNDELDHLGMYIKHNMYCLQLSNYPDDSVVHFQGYREELDEYFCSLYHPQLSREKPPLSVPGLMLTIINYLDKNDINNRVEIANYLLDFSTESKQQLCDTISYTINRQKQTKEMLAFSTAGLDNLSLRYTVFIEQPGIQCFTKEYKRNYVLSTLIWNDEKDRVMLDFVFDKKDIFVGLNYIKYTVYDIEDGERQALMEEGKNRAKLRMRLYLQKYGHINDNDTCPCGSSKTYGECCKIKL